MKNYSHMDIAIASIQCFADDGTLDLNELNFLLGLALRDNYVDDKEKEVLSDIFAKVTKNDVEEKVWNRILEIKEKYDIK